MLQVSLPLGHLYHIIVRIVIDEVLALVYTDPATRSIFGGGRCHHLMLF